jgi:hypothetical protein
MNKLLLIPLALMVITTMISFADSGATYESVLDDRNPETITIGNETTTINIPNAEEQSFSIWESTGLVALLIIAIAVGTVAGVNILGSGLSDTSQMLLFNSTLFLGAWATLTVFSSNILFGSGETIMFIFWIVLTIVYVIGLGLHMTGGTANA